MGNHVITVLENKIKIKVLLKCVIRTTFFVQKCFDGKKKKKKKSSVIEIKIHRSRGGAGLGASQKTLLSN